MGLVLLPFRYHVGFVYLKKLLGLDYHYLDFFVIQVNCRMADSKEIKRLMSQRAYKKGQITLEVNALEGLEQKDISIHLLDQVISNIETNLKRYGGT